MAPATTTSREGQPWLPFAVFCVVGLLWLPALAGPFQFDDYNVIVGYAPVHSLAGWWQSLPGLRPLLKLSYTLNWSVSPAPFGFHLVNLLLHLLNGALLLAWARRALPLDRNAALALVALWLLHPVQTEAVTYIAGRSVTLSTTFLFAGLLLLARGGARAPAGAALCTALALAVRETAWVFPLLFALALWMQGHAARTVARAVAPSLLVVAVAAVYFLLEPHHRQMVDTSLGLRDLGAQLRAQLVALGYLLAQLVTLAPNIDPDLRVPAAWSPLLVGALLAWLAAMAGALAGVLRYRSWLAAGVLWFGLLLLPTNSLMPRVDLASERHLYAAWLGLLWGGVWLLRDWRWRVVPAALLSGLLAVATLVRNEDYRSELALWARTAQQSPYKARVWNNLGMACREAGRRDCAEVAFTRALELDPADPRPGANLYFLRHPRP